MIFFKIFFMKRLQILERKTPQDKEALDGFLRWFESLTKEKNQIYLFLASSEQFFYNWMQSQMSGQFRTLQITDLPKEKAEKVYDQMCEGKKFEMEWKVLYPIVGRQKNKFLLYFLF